MIQEQIIETLSDLLMPYGEKVESDLERWTVEPNVPDSLAEAMRYCVLGGGKRLRPALVYLSAEAVGNAPDSELLRRAAVAVELMHCCSLVHDDLPAMDNDTLRRGQPTAHVKFGHAMAILVGDSLMIRTFGLLVESGDSRSAKLAAELARASGPAGMIAGQVADMKLCGIPDGAEGLRYIHLRKTAAIIRAGAAMGAICADATREQLNAISNYAENLGLAFQLIDDILDVTSDKATLGKTPGKDASSDKLTYVSLLGLQQASQLGEELTEKARLALEPLGEKAHRLRRLAELLSKRIH